MRRAAVWSATVMVALCVFSSLPAMGAGLPTLELGAGIASGRLPGGGTFIVRPGGGVPATAVELWFRAPQTGFASPTPGLARLAAETVAASIPVTGTALAKSVADMGGKLSITTYPDSVAVSALVPATRAAQVVRQMTAAYFSPVTSEQGLKLAQRDLSQEALIRAFTTGDTLRDLLAAKLFVDGPAKYPALPPPADINKISYDAVQTFALRAFRAANAFLILTGAADAQLVGNAVAGRPAPADAAMEPAALEPTVPGRLDPLSRPFVEKGLGYAWIGPPIADEQAATALDFLADYLFRPDSGTIARGVAQANTGATINGQFVTYHDPGVMLVEISGGDPAAAQAVVDREVARVRLPLEVAAFNRARDAFTYHLLSDMQTPIQLADTLGWYAVEGNPTYAPSIDPATSKYFETARGLTPSAVAAVAQKYLAEPTVTITLTERKAAPAPSPLGAPR